MSDFDEKLNNLLSNPDALGQIFQLAQSLEGTLGSSAPPSSTPPPPQQTAPQKEHNSFSGMDFGTLMQFLPLIQKLGESNEDARAFLFAMRPYLKPERQKKIEQALQLSRLLCVGKSFLKNREG